MPRTLPQVIALCLVSCFVLCEPALVTASTLSQTSQSAELRSTNSKPNGVSGFGAPVNITSERASTKGNKHKSEAVSAQRTIKKDSLRSQVSKTSKKAYVKSGKRFRKLAHHRALLGDAEDCDACHNQCLLTSAACIAISIITACPACGLVCLAYQLGCQTICNGTTACKSKFQPMVPPTNN
jgi:hypothetical protein